MATTRKRVADLDDHCHQPIRAKGKRRKVAHKVPPDIRKHHVPSTTEVEANIYKMVYGGMVFYDFESILRPLDRDLEVKVWDTIVRRSREFPELIFSMADLDLLNARKVPRLDTNSPLNIEPALKNRSGFHAHKLFDAEGTTGRDQNRKQYTYEKILKLSYDKEFGIRWRACAFIPFRLRREELILRRSNIGGQKLWIPVRPSSSGLSKWTELIVPRMVGDTPVWVSAEGIVGYLRPVKILGVQVWLPTPSKNEDVEEVTRRPLGKNIFNRRKSNPEGRTTRYNKFVPSTFYLKVDEYLTHKIPRHVIFNVPVEEERRRREEYLCSKALQTLARKLVEKEDHVYPQVDLESSSSESGSDVEGAPDLRKKEEEDKKIEEPTRPPRDRRSTFFGNWTEKETEERRNSRMDSVGRRMVTSYFLPNQDVPVITAIAQSSWNVNEEDQRWARYSKAIK